MSSDAFELFVEPRPSHQPVAANGTRVLSQSQRDFFVGEASIEAHFDDLSLAGTKFRELVQQIVNLDGFLSAAGVECDDILQGERGNAVVAFLSAPAPGVIDHDAPHDLSGNAKEVRPILALDFVGSAHADVRLMDQSRGLQGMTGTLRLQARHGQAVEFDINPRHQDFLGRSVTFRETLQKERYVSLSQIHLVKHCNRLGVGNHKSHRYFWEIRRQSALSPG
jgi:hypothetical protein